MAKPSRLNKLIGTVTKDVVNHPRDLTRYYADTLKISRTAANQYIQKLEAEGWIARSGPSTHPVFSLGYKRRVSGLYPLHGLEEDIVWRQDFKPFFSFRQNVNNIVVHGFTEMLNNAIDHSSGDKVFVWCDQHSQNFTIAISDNGVGIFEKITKALNLPDVRLALLELSKGKFTTDPDKHSGEGIFFTSRIFDRFLIYANNLKFSHDETIGHDFLQEDIDVFDRGTTVFMAIDLESTKDTSEIFKQFTDSPEDFDFSKTIVPMKLAKFGDEQLISRSQAKRLIARFDRFKTVILDFSGVQEIGQAFSDELFRVYATNHPEVRLIPDNMTEQVKRMWMRATSSSQP